MQKTVTVNQWGEVWIDVSDVPGVILDIYCETYLLVHTISYQTNYVYRAFGNIAAGNLALTTNTTITIIIRYV